jgi:hypothetical protein
MYKLNVLVEEARGALLNLVAVQPVKNRCKLNAVLVEEARGALINLGAWWLCSVQRIGTS